MAVMAIHLENKHTGYHLDHDSEEEQKERDDDGDDYVGNGQQC